MTQADIFGLTETRAETRPDPVSFGSIQTGALPRLPSARALLARLLASLPFEHLTDRTHGQPAWMGLGDIWPGDAARGAAMVREWNAGESRLFTYGSEHWPQGFGFDWLRDLAATGATEAQWMAYAATFDWQTRFGRRHGLAWRSDLLARRLANWTCHFDLIAAGAPTASARDALHAELIDSARRQLRHLARLGATDVEGEPRIGALCQGVAAAIALTPGTMIEAGAQTPTLAGLMRALAGALAVQQLPDGGHVSRSPARQFAVVCDLAAARSALDRSGLGAPDWLVHALDRAAPILRMLRHGDGGLALMQGAQSGNPRAIDAALARTETGDGRPVLARDTGYARVEAGSAVLVMDCMPGRGPQAHAGPLAIELSIGRQRLIVNCGAMAGGGAAWQKALRATAAHSTLTVADTNAAMGGGADPDGPRASEADGAWLVEAAHRGYAGAFGLVHRRSVYADSKGADWRGEDVLEPATPEGATRRVFAVRFHLHPRVRATLAQDKATVLIRLPDKSGWRFRARGGQVQLAASVYVPDGRTVHNSEQIVVTGATTAEGAHVRWALQRVA